METVRDDFMTTGYEVIREGEGTVLMRKSTWGTTGMHIVVALFTVWWTLGIGNLIYALIAHYTAEQVLLKMEAPEEAAAQPTS
ncbi:MAG TPA: hypothetical protein VM305_01945 [Candidatus Limnocylindrales bacterium]|nr:hypothetical protein [Candidatus Limnocylindrales bacterium]